MKKYIRLVLTCLLAAVLLSGCGLSDKGSTASSEGSQIGTMEKVHVSSREKIKFLTLDDIYFPEGILDTGLGMFIWDDTNKKWHKTNEADGKAVFDDTKKTMFFAHGMGGNGNASRPDLYTEKGYNVISFRWGTFSNEDGPDWYYIAQKIWDSTNMRWIDKNGKLVLDDLPDATVAEIYGAYYYDLLSAFPNYSGSEIMIMGHSYGGMLTGAVLSYLVTCYNHKLIPAYMIPDKVNFLDPYFSRAGNSFEVPWLGDDTPKNGNALEALYNATVEAKKLGVAIGLIRTSKYVCYPTTLNAAGLDVTGNYWKLCNNIVYMHMDEDSNSTFPDYTGMIHQYGWDWFTDYYTGYVIKDASATTEEEAYCIGMSYESLFARGGTKYEFNLNDTFYYTDDDIIVSFFCDYDPDINDSIENENEQILEKYKKGKAIIAGFAYLDANGNGKMDERLKDHFSGVKVKITDASGAVVYEDTTGLNGYYEYKTDKAGEYTVTFEAPTGYKINTEKASVNITDSERQLAINNVAVTK